MLSTAGPLQPEPARDEPGACGGRPGTDNKQVAPNDADGPTAHGVRLGFMLFGVIVSEIEIRLHFDTLRLAA